MTRSNSSAGRVKFAFSSLKNALVLLLPTLISACLKGPYHLKMPATLALGALSALTHNRLTDKAVAAAAAFALDWNAGPESSGFCFHSKRINIQANSKNSRSAADATRCRVDLRSFLAGSGRLFNGI